MSNRVNFSSKAGCLTCLEKSGQREYPMILGPEKRVRNLVSWKYRTGLHLVTVTDAAWLPLRAYGEPASVNNCSMFNSRGSILWVWEVDTCKHGKPPRLLFNQLTSLFSLSGCNKTNHHYRTGHIRRLPLEFHSDNTLLNLSCSTFSSNVMVVVSLLHPLVWRRRARA